MLFEGLKICTTMQCSKSPTVLVPTIIVIIITIIIIIIIITIIIFITVITPRNVVAVFNSTGEHLAPLLD